MIDGHFRGSVASPAGAEWNSLSEGNGRAMSDFKERHFEGETVLWAVVGVTLPNMRLCFNLDANLIPAAGASEREAGQRQRGHTWRA